MNYTFWDIVVVEGDLIWVIVKSWKTQKWIKHEVYVRHYEEIKEVRELDIERYLVRHKDLSEEEINYQRNAREA